jgi:hypothetical protein
MAGHRSKSKQTSSRIFDQAHTPLVPVFTISGIHPAVPAQLYRDISFLVSDLTPFSASSLEICLRSHPIGVTPANDSGHHRVVTGLRTWQLLQTLSQRGLVSPRFVPVILHREAISDEKIAALAAADILVSLHLYCLPLETGDLQIPNLMALINDEARTQLFQGEIRYSDLRQTVTPVPKRNPDGASHRGPGRPRVRPLRDPNAPPPKRGRPPGSRKVAENAVPTSGLPPDLVDGSL